MREITKHVAEILKREEGFRALAYDDARPNVVLSPGDKIHGTLTIGYGHTGPDVMIGQTISREEAEQLLDKDLDTAERAVASYVEVPLNDNEFGALVMFTYNVGVGAFQNSTLLRLLNKGQYGAVPSQLARWDKTTINGKKVQSKGLAKRRAVEAALWAEPVAGEVPVVEAKTPAEVPDRTLAETKTGQGAGIAAVGTIGAMLSEMAEGIEPLTTYSSYIGMAFAALGFCGVVLTVYGRYRLLNAEGR